MLPPVPFMLQSSERLLLTAWVGALWGVGYLAVPVLFASLDDRMLAGQLAGRMFHLVSWLGLGCGGLLIGVRLWRGAWSPEWRLWVLIGMVLLVLVGEFVIQPQMAELKAEGPFVEGSARAAAFGRLHGIASILYLITSLGGAALAAAGLSIRRVR